MISTRGTTRLVTPEGPVVLRPRERAVLAAIAARHPRPADPDDVVTLVWGPAPPGTVRKSLHNHVSRIRNRAPGLIETSDDGYAIADAVVDHTDGDVDEIPLADLHDSADVDELRRQLDEEFHTRLEQDVRCSIAQPTDETLRAARHLVQYRPHREPLWFLLASTLTGLGDRREALATIAAARRTLLDAGLDPGTDLRRLERELLEPSEEPPPVSSDAAARLHPHRHDPFVGRAEELAELESAWARTCEIGEPNLVVVRGPAGIGKTRLVDEFVRRFDGADRAPGIVTTRERRTDERPLGGLTDLATAHEPDRGADGDSDDPTDDDIDASLQRRLDAAVGRLAASPTVWCLDDLHWMAGDLLHRVARSIESTTGPLLVIATHRVGELDDPGALDRRAPTSVIELSPMSRDELDELVTAWQVLPARSTSLDVLHRRTAGLPLFVNEVARAANRRGEQLEAASLPGVLRDWVRTRFDELDADAAALLQTAALIGLEFDLDVAAEASGLAPERTDELMDDLVTRGVLGVASRPGRFEFAHPVTHEVAAEMTGPARARRQHLRIAEVLAGRPDHGRVGEWNGAMAHHLHLGGGAGEEVRRHAGLAHEDHVRQGAWSAADTVLDVALASDPDPAERADLLARRGHGQVRLQRFDEAAASLHEAIRLARSERLPDVRGRAALDLVGRGGRGAAIEATDAERVEIVRGALDALGDDGEDTRARSVLRSELERELAYALILGGDLAERRRLLEDSLDRVRALDPPAPRPVAAAMLAHRYAQPEPESSDRRRADIEAVLAMDHEQVGPELVATANVYLADELLRIGRTDDARLALDDVDHVLDRRPHPYWSWAAAGWRVLLAVVEGDLELAETLSIEAWTEGGHTASATAGYGVHLTNIRLLQGRSGEMIDLLGQAVEASPAIPAYRAVLSLCASRHGDEELAQRHLDWFSEFGFASIPEDPNRPLALAVLAHTAADLGDRDAARELLPLVERYDGSHIVISTYGSGGAYWGTASHALARLASTVGDAEAAARWFDAAERDSAHAPLFAELVSRDRAAAAARVSDPDTIGG